ncbi:MAG: hypothetical protein SH809_08235 [Rhodothermales bacterium]|nr:hypothetical protein [Rhodothermales bacterium]
MPMTPHSLLSRRRFLGQSISALGISALYPLLPASRASGPEPAVPMRLLQHEIGISLYDTFDLLVDWNVDAVELSGNLGVDTDLWKFLIRTWRIVPSGDQVALADLEGDALAQKLTFSEAVENTRLILRGLPEGTYDSREQVLRMADRLNGIARSLAPHGMQLGVASQRSSFVPYSGELAWNILADHTDETIALQLSTADAGRAGVDVAALLYRNAARTPSTRVRGFKAQDLNATIAVDDLDWTQIIRTSQQIGTQFFVIDSDRTEGDDFPSELFANLVTLRLKMTELGIKVPAGYWRY